MKYHVPQRVNTAHGRALRGVGAVRCQRVAASHGCDGAAGVNFPNECVIRDVQVARLVKDKRRRVEKDSFRGGTVHVALSLRVAWHAGKRRHRALSANSADDVVDDRAKLIIGHVQGAVRRRRNARDGGKLRIVGAAVRVPKTQGAVEAPALHDCMHGTVRSHHAKRSLAWATIRHQQVARAVRGCERQAIRVKNVNKRRIPAHPVNIHGKGVGRSARKEDRNPARQERNGCLREYVHRVRHTHGRHDRHRPHITRRRHGFSANTKQGREHAHRGLVRDVRAPVAHL